jgi:phage terminase small subunit
MAELTARQQRFVEEYLLDLNATKAAERAGYSAKTANEQGCRLLANVSVAKAVQAAMDKRSEKTGITTDYVLQTIVETIERSKQAKPVTYKNGDPVMVETPEGQLRPAYTFDAGAVLKGAELLGKHLKLFTEKTELTGAGGGPVETVTRIELVPMTGNDGS